MIEKKNVWFPINSFKEDTVFLLIYWSYNTNHPCGNLEFLRKSNKMGQCIGLQHYAWFVEICWNWNDRWWW